MPPRKKTAAPAAPTPAPGSMETEFAALQAAQEKRRGPRVELHRYPHGSDGAAVFEPVITGTTHDNAMSVYAAELERHVYLFLAAHRGTPALGGDGSPLLPAYAVRVLGLPTYPYGHSAIVESEAMLAECQHPADVIAYRVHTIQTSRGRVLWKAGTAAATARRMGQSLAQLRPTA